MLMKLPSMVMMSLLPAIAAYALSLKMLHHDLIYCQ